MRWPRGVSDRIRADGVGGSGGLSEELQGRDSLLRADCVAASTAPAAPAAAEPLAWAPGLAWWGAGGVEGLGGGQEGVRKRGEGGGVEGGAGRWVERRVLVMEKGGWMGTEKNLDNE